MKVVQNCTALAAALSVSYRSYDETYNPKTGVLLEKFLESNGVLLTMCMRFRGLIPWRECSRGKHDSKLSASWVQEKKTRGLRVIGKPIDAGPPVGLVLKPTATEIRCLYPADAATDGRDDDGCGPSKTDVHDGSRGYDHSNWFGKQLWKTNVLNYKNSKYGANRTFETIPCDEFFAPTEQVNDIQPPNPPVIGLMSNNADWIFENEFAYSIEQWSYIMGHSICNTSHPVPKPDLRNATAFTQLIYMDKKSWAKSEWVDAVRLMGQAIDNHPALDVWNELVLQVPTADTEATFANKTVQAVFYLKGNGVVMDEIARRVAIRETKKMNKPLMHIDLSKLDDSGQDLFQCESRDDAENSWSFERTLPMFLRGKK